jgi:ElaB/YqjD/DUF883 family membrane-anchored ribosome-binding protein
MTMQEAHTTVNEAERALHSATDRLARAAHQAVDTLSEYGARAEDRLRTGGAAAAERSREVTGQVMHYVEEHPLVALGIAAAVGFTIGALLRGGDAAEAQPHELSS